MYPHCQYAILPMGGEEMKILANLAGAAAVVIFALSFQCKTRRSIIWVNLLSRVFYILQYLLLGAVAGAAFDLLGALAAWPAGQKDKKLVQKYKIPILMVIFALVAGAGVALYQNLWSLLPLAGVVFEIAALWLSREKHIRLVSFLAQPFWLAYNLHCLAFGSAVGNVFTMVSITVALLRFSGRLQK